LAIELYQLLADLDRLLEEPGGVLGASLLGGNLPDQGEGEREVAPVLGILPVLADERFEQLDRPPGLLLRIPEPALRACQMRAAPEGHPQVILGPGAVGVEIDDRLRPGEGAVEVVACLRIAEVETGVGEMVVSYREAAQVVGVLRIDLHQLLE